jgi:hypothetical protein
VYNKKKRSYGHLKILGARRFVISHKFHTEGPTDTRRQRTGVCAPLVMIMCPVAGTDVRARSVLRCEVLMVHASGA